MKKKYTTIREIKKQLSNFSVRNREGNTLEEKLAIINKNFFGEYDTLNEYKKDARDMLSFLEELADDIDNTPSLQGIVADNLQKALNHLIEVITYLSDRRRSRRTPAPTSLAVYDDSKKVGSLVKMLSGEENPSWLTDDIVNDIVSHCDEFEEYYGKCYNYISDAWDKADSEGRDTSYFENADDEIEKLLSYNNQDIWRIIHAAMLMMDGSYEKAALYRAITTWKKRRPTATKKFTISSELTTSVEKNSKKFNEIYSKTLENVVDYVYERWDVGLEYPEEYEKQADFIEDLLCEEDRNLQRIINATVVMVDTTNEKAALYRALHSWDFIRQF